MMAIRSNNDIEGWHNGLHRRASGKWNMPFYLLIDLLHQEAQLTALQIRLVSEKKLKRIQRAKYRSLQAKIFAISLIREKMQNNSLSNVLILMDHAKHSLRTQIKARELRKQKSLEIDM